MKPLNRRHVFNLVITACFLVNIFVPFAGMWLPAGSGVDQRALAPFPALSLTGDSLRGFPKKFELFVNDHFGLRNQYIGVQNNITQSVFKDAKSSKVLFGEQGWLFYAGEKSREDLQRVSYFSADDLKNWRDSISERGEWLRKQGVAYRFVVPPDKHSVYPEMLPQRYSWPGPSRFDLLKKSVGTTPYLVDIGPAMRQQKQVAGSRLYFQTDTHWTRYGAYVGYRKVMKSLSGAGLAASLTLADPQFVDDHTPKLKDLARMAQMARTEANLTPASSWTWCGQPEEVMVPPGLDVSSMLQFTAYACPGKKKTALIFHDSFMEFLAPYLDQEFGRVVYVWGEPNDDVFIRMVQQEHPDVVIEERVERSMQYVPRPGFASAVARISAPAGNAGAGVSLEQAQQDVYALVQGNAVLGGTAAGGEFVQLNGRKWADIRTEASSAGALDKFQQTGDGYWVTGWAGFPAEKERADFIVVVVGGRVIFVAPANTARNDVARYFNAPAMTQSGFNFVIPAEILVNSRGDLRLFAVRGRKVEAIKTASMQIAAVAPPRVAGEVHWSVGTQ